MTVPLQRLIFCLLSWVRQRVKLQMQIRVHGYLAFSESLLFTKFVEWDKLELDINLITFIKTLINSFTWTIQELLIFFIIFLL